ncbi:hypothetical protein NBRC116494_29070 [Aurantivibrio plasticivorans]
MKKIISSAVTALLLPAVANAEWTKSYVIEWNEPAMYFGGVDGSITNPGKDCPKGVNPELDWIKVLTNAGYSEEEAKWIRNPANPTRSPVHGQNQVAFRGKDRANVYVHPESYPDPGLYPMEGQVAEGLNLDGDDSTGLTSPAGKKGIDNVFYETLGCWKSYRGPERLSSGALQFNDAMRNGAWTTVVVVHGRGKDPLNDNNVEVGFYLSDDDMVKGGNGEIAPDYTFVVKPDAKYEAIFKAKTENGVIKTKKPSEQVMLRDPGYTRDLELLDAQLELVMNEDGTLRGYVGGYRPWMKVYQGWVDARGPVIEALTWVELPAVYYALKRTADYKPKGAKGPNTHISYALRIDAIPAYVMSPDAHNQVAKIKSYKALVDEPPQVARATRFRVIDGLVPLPDKSLKYGPDVDVFASRKTN